MNLGVQLNAGDHFLHLPAGGIPATVAPLGFVKVPVARLTGCYQQLDAMGVSYDPLSVFVDPTALQNLTARCADFEALKVVPAMTHRRELPRDVVAKVNRCLRLGIRNVDRIVGLLTVASHIAGIKIADQIKTHAGVRAARGESIERVIATMLVDMDQWRFLSHTVHYWHQ